MEIRLKKPRIIAFILSIVLILIPQQISAKIFLGPFDLAKGQVQALAEKFGPLITLLILTFIVFVTLLDLKMEHNV